MAREVSIVLSGIGGYASNYTDVAFDTPGVRVAGIVDPRPEGYARWDEIKDKAPRFDSLEDFFANEQAELTVISTPIPLHAPQASLAISMGSNVLCEKPAAATPQDIRLMMEARDNSQGLFCDIGYQWSHSAAVLRLKEVILSGRLGRAIRLKTHAHWPRNAAYYARAKWPGQVRDAQGNFILDSVASNATAHYLHNMFFVLGDQIDRSAYPATLEAELYRANPIATFDTVMMRAYTDQGVELLYYASHAVKESIASPEFHYEFTGGTVTFPESQSSNNIIIRYSDGTVENVGDPYADQMRKFDWSLDAIRGECAPPPCTLEASLPLTLAICGMHRSMPRVTRFPDALTRVHGDNYTYIKGLGDAIHTCFSQNMLPNELGLSWAHKGERISITPQDVFEDPGIE